jgi:hypothetical protein
MLNRSNVHLARELYESLDDLLEDLQRVTHDLRAVVTGQLLVPADDLDFLTRRADYLAAGAIDTIRSVRVVPHHLEAAEES